MARAVIDMKSLAAAIKSIDVTTREAATEAINRVAWYARSDVQDEMKKVFKDPTRFTINSVRVIKPDKNAQTIQAVVHLSEDAPKGTPPSEYLKPQIEGGARKPKRSERHLVMRGRVEEGTYILPRKDQQRMRGGQVQRVLSRLKANFDSSQDSTERSLKRAKDKTAYFVGKPGAGTGALGIYQRKGAKGRELVSLFRLTTSRPQYRKLLDFNGIVEATRKRRIEKVFQEEIAKAAGRMRG